MDISTGWLKSDIHTWIYPWISISTASLPPIQFPGCITDSTPAYIRQVATAAAAAVE